MCLSAQYATLSRLRRQLAQVPVGHVREGPARHRRTEIGKGHRPSEEEALVGVAAELAEEKRLHVGLDAFGYDRKLQRASDIQDGLHDHPVARVALQVAN